MPVARPRHPALSHVPTHASTISATNQLMVFARQLSSPHGKSCSPKLEKLRFGAIKTKTPKKKEACTRALACVLVKSDPLAINKKRIIPRPPLPFPTRECLLELVARSFNGRNFRRPHYLCLRVHMFVSPESVVRRQKFLTQECAHPFRPPLHPSLTPSFAPLSCPTPSTAFNVSFPPPTFSHLIITSASY